MNSKVGPTKWRDTSESLFQAIAASSFHPDEMIKCENIEKQKRLKAKVLAKLDNHSEIETEENSGPTYQNPERPLFIKNKNLNLVKYDQPIRHSRARQLENPCYLPSVSKILKESMPEERKIALQRWEESMILKLGKEGFQEYQKRMLLRGERLHSFVEQKLLHKDVDEVKQDEDQVSENHKQSIEGVLGQFSKPFALESHLIHPYLGYQGEETTYNHLFP